MQMRRLVVPVLAALLLAACGQQELYTQLSEQQANEMVAVLRNAGLAGDKEPREGQTFAVTTRGVDFARAVAVLRAGGYPRESHDSMGRVFKKEGFVSSPLEERARLVHALSQEIAHTLSQIDGVLVARVHLAVPDKDPLADKPQPAAASVFIKHRVGKDLSGSVGQIKALVVNGVEGLPYDNVTVVLFPAEPWPETGTPAAAVARAGLAMDPTLVALAGGGGALALGGSGLWAWRRRQAAPGRARPAKPAARPPVRRAP
ncbi:MAG: type III secretion system inner membrane ring lipoprotein SctJ [Pseudomonadota bacterium]